MILCHAVVVVVVVVVGEIVLLSVANCITSAKYL